MIRYVFIIFFLLISLPNISFADIYKWKDEKGTINFSDSPNSAPENVEKITQQTITSNSSNPKYDYPLTKGAIQGVKNLNEILNDPKKVLQSNPYGKELKNEIYKLAENTKYWKDPQTNISYKMPFNEHQVLQDRQRIKQQKIQLETAQATAGAFILFIIIAIGTYLILSIISFFDILKSKFEGNEKIIWVLVIIFVPIIGEIAYLTIGRKQKIKEDNFTFSQHYAQSKNKQEKFCNAFRCNGIMTVKTDRGGQNLWVCNDCGMTKGFEEARA